MRYGVIQHTPTGLACDAGLPTLLCRTRGATIAIYQHTGFGALALAAAAINLWRPWLPLFVLGMIAAALGIVLYNVVLSGLAAALLILSLARPAAAARDDDRGKHGAETQGLPVCDPFVPRDVDG